jgi:hypothetical protein
VTIVQSETKVGTAPKARRFWPWPRWLRRTLAGVGLVLCALIITAAALLWRVLPPQ